MRLNDEALAALRQELAPEVIRIGAPQDVAERWLPPALARFARAHREVRFELRVDHSRALLGLVREGKLDLCACFGLAEDVGGQELGSAPVTFFAASSFTVEHGEPLPLVLLEAPCVFRTAALQALDAVGRSWRVAVSTPSVAALWAAVSAGLGVTARVPIAVPRGVRPLRQGSLPGLSRASLTLHGEGGTPTARTLKREVAAELKTRLASTPRSFRMAKRAAGGSSRA